jgi:hypothetical protein
MNARLPLYREVAPGEKCDAELLRGDTFLPLQLCFDPGSVVEQPLPNDMRDVPADVARRATFTVPIAREDEIIDRRVTPGAGATIAAVEAARAAMPDERTQATIAHVSKTIVSTAIERSA